MNLSNSTFSLLILIFTTLVSVVSFAQNGVPKAFNVQGTIYQPGGNNPFLGTANMRFQILNEAATCLMYEETVTGVNTTNTNGAFSVDLGTTATRSNKIDSTTTLGLNIFKNNVTYSSTTLTRITGCPDNLVIGANETRKLRISFDVSGSYSDMTPDIEMLTAPYAMIAETLDGYSANEFIMVNTSAGRQVSQINLETLLNNLTKFNTLNNFAATGNITGNAATATTAGTVSDGAITAVKLAQMGASPGQVLKWNGTGWAASNDNSGVGTITSSDITTALTYTPVGPAGTVANATNAVNATNSTNATTAVNFSGSLSGDVSGTQSSTTVNSVGGKSAAQIAASVNDTLAATNANTLSTIVKRDGSGNIAVSNLLATNVSSTNNSIQNLYLFDQSNNNRILLKAPINGITNYTLTLPPTVGTTGQVLSTNASGDLSWITASSGDVTSVAGRTGVVTLSSADISGLGNSAGLNVGTAAGTVAAGDDVRLSNTRTPTDNTVSTIKIQDNAITSIKILDGTISSTDISNASIEASHLARMGANFGEVLKFNGTNWVASADNSGNSGTVTSVSSATTDITITNPATTPELTLNAATTGANKILRLDGSGKIDASTLPNSILTTASILSGDVSGTNTTTSVDKIKGVTVSASAPTTAGQVLRYNGSQWVPNFIAMTDLRSSVTGGNAFASSCGANQTLTYNSVGDVMSCSNIAISISQISGLASSASIDTTNASNLTTGTVAAARMPALTGDVTMTAGTTTTALANDSVTTAKINALAVTDAKINDVAWSKITSKPTTASGYGITDAVSNAGSAPSIQTGLDSSKPSSGWTAGRLYVASDTKKIYYDNGSSWIIVGTTVKADISGVAASGANADITSMTAVTAVTSTTALGLNAGGTNQNVNLAPTGTGTVDVASKRITNVATPTATTDAPTKAYVDAAVTGGGSISMISAESASTYTIATGSAYCRSLNAACQYNSDGSACGGTTYTGWKFPTAEDLGLFVGLTASGNYLWTRSVYYGGGNSFVYYRLSDGGWSYNLYNSGNYVRCVR